MIGTPTSPYTIGLIQMRCSKNPKESLAKAISMLEKAAKKGVQVACLPELFLTDYFCQRLDPDMFNLAEPADGPTTKALAVIAKKHKMVIINSIFEKAAPGLYYNTAVTIDADGKIADIYRKMHIPHDPLFEEKYYFTPGDLGFRACDTKAGRIGTLVCWDQWYPEAARLTAMQGATTLFYPTAIGWQPYEKKEFGEAQVSAWETMQRSHAIANGVYVAAVNRIGHEGGGQQAAAPAAKPHARTSRSAAGASDTMKGGIEFWGHSFICDPFGRILAMGSHDKEEVLTATVDPKWSEQTRRWWPFFRDRRVDAYGGLTSRWITDNR